VNCVGATYSGFGVECSDCPAPNIVNAATCKASNGATCELNADETGCNPAETDNCMFNIGHTTCTPCVAGEGPNAEYTGCDQCSTIGPACTGAADANGVVCALSEDGASCLPSVGLNCVHTAAARRPAFSSTGVCQECAFPNVVDAHRETCTTCGPGKQPNAHRTVCEVCVGTYSEFGIVCKACSSGEVPNANISATTCEDDDECRLHNGFGPCDTTAAKIGPAGCGDDTQPCNSTCRNEDMVRYDAPYRTTAATLLIHLAHCYP
jgi:hypothetical protein